MENRSPLPPDEYDYCPEIVIAFLLIGFSGFLFGLGAGWLMWG